MVRRAEINPDIGDPLIAEMRGAGKRFSGGWAVRGLALQVKRGESVAVIGPNGSGKTTLLRLLATLWTASTGEVRLFGYRIEEMPCALRLRIGYLGHKSLLYPQLTVRENLLFYARLYGVSAPSARLQELSHQLGLVGWSERRVSELSRGLEQRVALARTLIHSPTLILLDEPFSGLDSEASQRVLEILRAQRQAEATVVLSTHDFAYAEQLCTRVVCLRSGQVAYDGPMIRPLQAAYTRFLTA